MGAGADAGQRAIIANAEISIVSIFQLNGFDTYKPGVPVKLVFDERPRPVYHAETTTIPRALGQG